MNEFDPLRSEYRFGLVFGFEGMLAILMSALIASACSNNPPPSMPSQVSEDTVVTDAVGESTASPSTEPGDQTALLEPKEKQDCTGPDSRRVFDWVKNTGSPKTANPCTSATIDESICSQTAAPAAFGAGADLAKPMIDQAFTDGFKLSPKDCGRFSNGVVILIFSKIVEENGKKKVVSKRICSATHSEC